MAERTFELQQLVLLPVGTEVEIRFYRKPKRSAWDGSVKDLHGESVRTEAVVRDINTGILFGMDWHFQLGLESRKEREACRELIVVDIVQGRVKHCQVLSCDGPSEFRIQTWVTLEVDDD